MRHLCADATGPWKASSLEKLGPAKDAAVKALDNLGKAPESLTAAALLDELESRLKAHWLKPLPPAPSFGGVTQARDSREAADAVMGIFKAVEAWLDAKLDASRPDDLLGRAELLVAFQDVFGDDKLEMRTKRFGNAQRLLYAATLEKFVSCAAVHCPNIKRRALDQLDAALCAGNPAPVNAIVANVITLVIYRCVGPAFSVPSALKVDTAWVSKNGTALLTEDDAVAADRIAKKKKLQDILDCINIVSDIAKLPAPTAAAGAAGAMALQAAAAPRLGGAASGGSVRA